MSLLAHLVHDLKNPLGIVLGYAEALTLAEGAEQAELSARLMINARSLLEVLDEYSLLTDLRRKRVQLDRGDCNWQAITARVIKAVTETARERDQEVCNDVDQQVTVYADPQRLEQAIRLLVREALRASSRGARLELSAQLVEDAVEMRLAVGPGSAQPMPDRTPPISVFDSRRPAIELVQRVVELHGGVLAFAAEPERAVASIRLPNAKPK